MINRIRQFDWAGLYNEYDKTCKRFDSDSSYLYSFSTKPQNDRELYYMLVDRVANERSIAGFVSLGTYEAILYWKLYSQPAAVANVCRRVRNDVEIQSNVEHSLAKVCEQMPQNAMRDLELVRGLYEALKLNSKFLFGMKNPCALPVMSTLLHFLYPGVVPLFDKQVLSAVGVKEQNANKSLSRLFQYMRFAWELSNDPDMVPQDWRETPLRLVDMALWVTRGT